MRYATVEYRPVDGWIHPVDGAFCEAREVTRESIDHINRLSDGTGIVTYYLRGDADRVREILRDQPAVIDWKLTETGDGIQAYIHAEPSDTITGLSRLATEHEIVLDMPVECLDRGGVRSTIIGDDATFERAFSKVPENVRVELVETGEYDPERQRLLALLTERQRDILETAVEMGYYDEPRQTTYADIAQHVDRSPATVGEHLRKIEGKILRELVG